MDLWSPQLLQVDAELDARLAAIPNRPAVFLIRPREGEPYLGKTAQLRRRLARLLGERPRPSRMLNLRDVAARVEFQFSASSLETNLVYYAVARSCFPESYRSAIRLRMPPYVKVGLSNAFPRCYISTRVGGSRGLWYGPFRSRVAAELFESRFLDLFQMRRCQEDLSPSPDHPGCIYGEMSKCLRPCQAVVGAPEYASEVARVLEFLSTGGRSLVEATVRARDRLSVEMQFEEAARVHRQLDAIQQVLRLRDELVRDAAQAHGVAVTRSADDGSVELWFMRAGCWLAPVRFRVEASGDKMLSLDQRLREIAAGLPAPRPAVHERQDHLALLARWYYSTNRDGEWLPFDGLSDLPYRKLVRAISRVAAGSRESASS